MFNLSAGPIFAAASALLVVALGVFVGTIRPRTGQNLAFAVFAVCFGFGFPGQNLLAPGNPWKPVVNAFEGLLFLVATVALIIMAHRHAGDKRWPKIQALVFATAYFLASFAFSFLSGGEVANTPASLFRSDVALGLLVATMWAMSLLFALRYAHLGPDAGRERHQLALMGVAIGAYPSVTVTFALMGPGWPSWYGVLNLATGFVVAAAWFVGMARSTDPRPARAAGWVILGLVGLFLWAGAQGPYETVAYPVVGTARTLSVLVLAYAIMRHQLLGIDVKVRWTISKTTIAAVFVAVFFVASEAAQQFFGETLGSAYVGILAAGALVFAIAPLSRFADRLAEKAVPMASSTKPAAASVRASAERVYRAAVRTAIADGRLTAVEETLLAEIAQEIGLGPADALRLRHEVEAEAGRQGVA